MERELHCTTSVVATTLFRFQFSPNFGLLRLGSGQVMFSFCCNSPLVPNADYCSVHERAIHAEERGLFSPQDEAALHYLDQWLMFTGEDALASSLTASLLQDFLHAFQLDCEARSEKIAQTMPHRQNVSSSAPVMLWLTSADRKDLAQTWTGPVARLLAPS